MATTVEIKDKAFSPPAQDEEGNDIPGTSYWTVTCVISGPDGTRTSVEVIYGDENMTDADLIAEIKHRWGIPAK